jgi:hypothetical protein
MKKFALIIVAIGLIVVGGVALATSGVKKQEGYAEFQMPEIEGLEPQFSLKLGPLGLKPLVWAAGMAEEKEADLLKNIDGLKVQIFEVRGDSSEISEQVGKALKVLKSQGWENTVVVNDTDEREHVRILTQIDGDAFTGAVISVVTPTEAVMINVMGRMSQEDIASVMELGEQL